MADSLVLLAQFATPEELHVVKSAIEAAGIQTATHDENMVGSLWHAGIALGGVKLLVNQQDFDQAQQIMQERQRATEDEVVAPWVCSNCGENIDAGFAVCWSCGMPFDEDDASTSEIDAAIEAAENEVDDDQLPLSRDVAKGMLSGYVTIAYSTAAIVLLLAFLIDYRFGGFVFVMATLFFGLKKLVRQFHPDE